MWIVGVVVVAALLVALLIAARNRSPATRAPAPPPELGGGQVPDVTLRIDFEKRYDFHCFPAGEHGVVLRRCKVLGTTGPGPQRFRVPAGEEEYLLAGGYGGRWLVLELPDGRRAYVPPESVRLIEESADKP